MMVYVFVFLALLGVSMSSLWLMWVLMELMTFIFIPWFLPESSRFSFYKMFYYFIIQSLASMLFLFSSISMNGTNDFFISLISMFSLWLKIGIYPFFSWMVMMIESMPWPKYITFLTWMKVIPLSLVMVMQFVNPLSWLLSLSNLAGIKSYSLYSMRQLMIISSVSHMSWMMMSLYVEKSLLLLYFLVYFINMVCLQGLCKSYNVNSMKSIMTIKSLPFWLLILSISGLPPFPIFFFKLWISKMMLISGNWMELIVILMLNIFPIYIYLIVIIMSMLLKKSKNYSFISYRLSYTPSSFYLILFIMINFTLLIL